MTEDENASPYDVGYRKPPRDRQFQPGQSGNLKGRPRKAKKAPTSVDTADVRRKLHHALLEELLREIPISENGKVTELPAFQALAKKLLAEAFKGKLAAFKIIEMLLIDAQKSGSMAIPDDETINKYTALEAAEVYRRIMGTAH